MDSQDEEDKLMKSVLEADKDEIDKGQMISDAVNNGINNFTPDMTFDKMVSNYKQAEKIMGESMIRALSGYDPSYIEKNINIPEFRRDLQKKLHEKFDEVRKSGLVDKKGNILDEGYRLSALVMYTKELENLKNHSLLGERPHKKQGLFGEKNEVKDYRKHDRYKSIDVKKTVKTTIRRGHDKILKDDLKAYTYHHKSSMEIIYAIDASGSMKGKKIGVSKKAGIALAYKAIENKDKVGIIVFGDEVREKVLPTRNFTEILARLAKVRASNKTDIACTIKEACDMFSGSNSTKHIMLITDAMPTVGEDPEEEVLKEVSIAKSKDITVSISGINIDDKGEELGRKIAEVSGGKFHIVKDLENMDKIILEDYYSYY